MDVPFELHVALRYLLARRKQAVISVISLISTAGVAIGVIAVIVALAMMTGLQQALRDRILGSSPHIYVSKPGGISDYRPEIEKLRQIPHVVGAAPAIFQQGLVSASRATEPVQIKGIDPALEPEVTDIRGAFERGSLDALASASADGSDGILLGKELARKLGAEVGDSVSVLTPQGTLSPLGMIPRPRRLRVVGIFSLGLYEFDSTFGFVSMDVAKRLAGREDVQLIQVRVDNIYDAPKIADSVSTRLGHEYIAEDWTDTNKNLFSALWLEKIAVSLAIGLIVIVAAMNIIATLILLVMEKSRDIAILKTMGAGARSVTAIFVMEGLIIGLTGTAIGAAVGRVLCYVFDHYKLIRVSTDVYQISYLPFTVLALDFTLVVVSAVVICLVATIYPSRQAARLDPALALRYE
jgi:lipoprotein-releasing system permease protein